MKEFSIFNHTFEITQQQINYVIITEKFTSIRHYAVEKFYVGYRGRYPTIENWNNDVYERVKSPLEEATKKSVDYLRTNGVYTVTERDFFDNSWDSRYLSNEIEDLTDRLSDVTNSANADITYREQRKQNRGRAVGFGFNMSGYIKGSMEAGAINMATGLGHSVINGIGNAATNASASSKMNGIIRSEDTVEALAKGISFAIYEMQNYAISVLGRETNIQCQVVTNEDEAKSDAILQSIDRIPKEERKKALIQAIELNYLNEKAYLYIAEHYPEEIHYVDAMATYLGIDVSEPIKNKINEKIKEIMSLQEKLWFTTFTPYDEIANIYEKYDIVMSDINETSWDEKTIESRITGYNYFQENMEIIPHKFLETDFGTREELLKGVAELQKFYTDVKEKDICNECIYSELKINFDTYEFLNIYHFELLYNALDQVKRIQNGIEIVQEMQNIFLKEEISKAVKDKFLFPDESNDFIKKEKQIKKNLSLNEKEEILCVVYLRMNQAFAFTTRRVLVFNHLLTKKHEAFNIEEVIPFIIDEKCSTCICSSENKKSFSLVLDDKAGIAFQCLCGLNSILEIVRMSMKNLPLINKKGDDIDIKNDRSSSNIIEIKQESGEEKKSISNTIFCPFCGKKILREVNFCNFCGKANNYLK